MFGKNRHNSTHHIIMEQIGDVEKCLHMLEEFVRAACSTEDPETLRGLAGVVAAAEKAADNSLRRMIDSLVDSPYLPSTREELISIATSCDRIANKCETFSIRVVQQRVRIPCEFRDALLEIIGIIHQQFSLLKTAISRMFSQFKELLKDHTILDEIRACESQVDGVERDLYEKIYRLDLDLAHQMQLASFIEVLCDIPDTVEDIADKIQIMLVTRKA